MSSRNFFDEPSRRASNPGQRERSSSSDANPFGFNLNPLNNTINNLTRSFINNPTINNLMSGSRTNPFNNDASSSRETGASCEACHTRFGFLRRRKTCSECQLDFCSNCFSPPSTSPTSSEAEYMSEVRPRRFCRKCRFFVTRPLDRKLLMRLSVKDLKFYLQRRRINCVHCKEKSELVDLVLQHNGYRVPTHGGEASPSSSSYRNQRRASEDPFLERNTVPSESSSNNSLADSWVILEDHDEDDDDQVSSQRPQRQPPLDQAEGGVDVTQPEPTPQFRASSESNLTSPKLNASRDFKGSGHDLNTFTIDDIKSEEQIRDLSARQLKLILTRNFVDYRGACEREELMNKVLRLWREKRDISDKLEDIPDENMCKICWEAPIDCVLLECGHLVTCVSCGKRLSECPVCRQYIVRAVRTFRS